MTDEQQISPGRVWPDLLAVPAAIGAMLLMLVTLPVSLPISLLLGWNGRRRVRAVARVTRCVRCGFLLGPDAPEVSDAAHMTALADAQRRYPGSRVHVARRAEARCPACGADYAWDGTHRALHVLAEPADADGGEKATDQVAEQGKEKRRCRDH